jgi:oligoribonuclease NrnB/cAMP/cGMP phosphodiesterase (DHH superfamily)
MKKTLIIYHGNCHDGFGGAFAAWKKFGNEAEYFSAVDRVVPPDVVGRDVVIIDFSYPKDVLQKMLSEAHSLAILDHHAGSETDIISVPNHVFALDHSGATLAWTYFFPNTPTPRLFSYLEQGDLYTFDLPRTLDVKTYIYSLPLDFQVYEKLLSDFEDDARLAAIADTGATYAEYRQIILKLLAAKAREVEFEGHRIFAANAPHEFRSDLGNYLAKQKPPFAIVWYPGHRDGFIFSMRGDGTVNLIDIAKKYGGGGHHNAASFRWDIGAKFPFKEVELNNQ